MSGSMSWIRWRKRALKGGGWGDWHAARHGDERMFCGMIRPTVRKDLEAREQVSETDDHICKACLAVGLNKGPK